VWTIGYGHTPATPGQVITQAQAEAYLSQDIASAESFVNSAVRVSISQEMFDALCDFVFNLGVGNTQRSTLLALVNKGNYSAAALEFDKWDKAGGKVVAGLLRRRQAETDEFKTGIPA
jgi:lysozyme